MIIKDDDLRRIIKLAFIQAFLVGDEVVDPAGPLPNLGSETTLSCHLNWKARYFGHIDLENYGDPQPRVLFMLSYDAGYEDKMTTADDVGDYQSVTFLAQSDWGDEPIAVKFDLNTWQIAA